MAWTTAITLACLAAIANGCGLPTYAPDLSVTRIVGGKEANPNSWPWQVALYYNGQQVCGGSLIDEEWVVTAAHCFAGGSTSSWLVYAGKHKLTRSEATQQNLRVAAIYTHGSYNSNTMHNDIALIKLSTKATFNSAVSAVCLPSKTQYFGTGRTCYATGWGETSAQGLKRVEKAASTTLQQVAVPIISSSTCGSSRYYGSDYSSSYMICAGYSNGGMDSCQGDSGGPLVTSVSGRWYLAGVTSWGIGCAKARSPGVYTRVTGQVDWINYVMQNY
ncbi:chymotrypsinogen A-like [Lineus longissimus]|uniref:chymotrypsinogen A-like n=1 Tax=Lineus longissimus TaxID=88925 RepID=UPI00315CE2C9